MIWAQWSIAAIAVIGAVLLVPLGIRLWRRITAFGSLLAGATATLDEATVALQAAQASLSAQTGSESRLAAYTDPKSE